MSEDFEYQLQQEFNESSHQQQKQQGHIHPQTNTYRDPNDGTEYEWNQTMKAWVPKIDDELIARYHSNYGYSAEDLNTTTDETVLSDAAKDTSVKSSEKPFVSKLLNKRKVEEKANEWFEISDEYNTKVYVSNLPFDTTEEEFLQLMKKCGLIQKNDKNEFKIKLYRDSNGQLKGDGLCTYIKIESVDLALNILDGYQFRDKTIVVERAKFNLKGHYNPSLKPKRQKKDKQKEKKKLEKLFDWRPEKIVTERQKCDKTVVIKNMFEPKQFLLEPKLILEYRSDLRDECTEKCGLVKRVDIYDCHPEGVAAITFSEFKSADQCVKLMNGRFFAGRRLTAHLWDGNTKYKIEETEEETEKRLQLWDQFLEKHDN